MLKIVAVDDEFLVLEGMKLLIDEINVESQLVGYAENGYRAWEVIEEGKPDVLITDIKMPGINGLELIRHCREKYPDMLFIVLSGYQEFAYAQQAIDMGVIGYIDKPITHQKLESALRKAEDLWCKKILKQMQNPALLQHFDELVREIYDGNYEKLEQIYQSIKGIMHQEKMALDEYKHYMFMMITGMVGSYYDMTAKGIGNYDKHFPSYRNLFLLTTYEEVDHYADTLVESIIEKIRIEKAGVVHGSIKNVIQYIQEHYSEDLSLNSLAETVEMNPVYLSSLFKQETGTSYVKYLTNIRLQKAMEFLQQGYRVAEVSEMVGYPNYRYFCDLFKKNVGVTPNEYKGTIRKNHAQPDIP